MAVVITLVMVAMGVGPSVEANRATFLAKEEALPDAAVMRDNLNFTYSDAADLTVDRFGRATAVWMAPADADGVVELKAATRTAPGGWSEPVTVGSLNEDRSYLGAESVDAVVDGQGRVTAMWSQSPTAVAVASRSSGGTWSEPIMFEGRARALTRNSRGVITLLTTTTRVFNPDYLPATLQVHRWRPDVGEWELERTIVASDSVSQFPLVEVASAGPRTVVAWTEDTRSGAGHSVPAKAAWADGLGEFGDVVSLTEVDVRVSNLKVAVEPGARATLAWVEGGSVITVDLRPDGVVSEPVPGPTGQPLALARSAGEVALMRQTSLVVRDADGVWHQRGTFSREDEEQHNLIVLPSGAFVASWVSQLRRFEGADERELYVATYATATGWNARMVGNDRFYHRHWTAPAGRHSAMLLWGSPLHSIVLDGDGPVTTMDRPGSPLIRRVGVPYRATAVDALSGVQQMQVGYRAAPYDQRFGPTRWLRADGATIAGRHAGKPGHTYCFRARARDEANNVGSYTPWRCTTTAVNDRALRASDGWNRRKASGAYRGTLMHSNKRGSRLVLTDVRAKRIAILASTNANGGRVRVVYEGKVIGRVSLATSGSQRKVIIPVATLPRVGNGRLVIRVISDGKPVRIEGVFAAKR